MFGTYFKLNFQTCSDMLHSGWLLFENMYYDTFLVKFLDRP